MRVRKGINLPINSVIAFAIAITAGVVVLAIILPLILSQEGAAHCSGPFRGVASVLSDMTGVTVC